MPSAQQMVPSFDYKVNVQCLRVPGVIADHDLEVSKWYPDLDLGVLVFF